MTPTGVEVAARRATIVAIAGNSLLFAVKGVIGFVSGSIALVSDALNSLVDVVASIGIAYSVAVAHREPDEDHPFGHGRAEPLAALGVAIFTAILGFSVGRAAFERLLGGAEPIRMAGWALGALAVSMVGNLLLARYLRRRGERFDSPAILANAVECENDIWVSVAAFIGVAGSALGWAPVDPLAGIVVGAWIVVGGYRFGRTNIDYLMGKSPPPELVESIRAAALGVPGVIGVHDVRGHHVGHRVHVEVHVEVDQELRTRHSHDLGGAARHAIEALPTIDRAFVHVDPVPDSTLALEILARNERTVSELYASLARAADDRPALARVWRALATRAQARVERLTVVRRLRGAGWHFADTELSVDRLLGRERRIAAMVGSADGGELEVDEALAFAAELETAESTEDYAVAVTPRDRTLDPSLAAATPPPPPLELVLRLVEEARAAEADPTVARALEGLARTLTEARVSGRG